MCVLMLTRDPNPKTRVRYATMSASTHGSDSMLGPAQSTL